ncbi:MAG TPA: cupin domain-containing protein [Bryobacterales bacterium]|nr:cupin domain-containing protein [Bryobacterales bacterium]
MKHYRWEHVTREQMNPLFARQVVHGERLTLARVHLKKGCKVPLHSHENEQISNVIEGRLRFEIGGEEKIVGPGELIHIPAHVPHLAEALDDCVCLDIFTPLREDWMRGDDAYLRR